ncbi:hypothetical protein ISF_03781 [Cordyceps fumosorosea ARSEF 2679]|uniref:Uncharacterized protein n=1 Tax=Cordyceps fumosorosea (strain ARSEF 2679) TaxID=1081104 RepID=A0A167ZJX0_CORFA|nr:hypothetical protein ISF_03781 [Cordyceps fumosorosea ARSEF 2679]OAA67605.1 hypothetical protein ISF_03781 [Cordyceps fumosorosea ARSEF 2679]
MPGPKPKLEVATPVTSNFPSEIASATSVSTATPLSSLSLPAIRCCKAEPDFIKTPITPPLAYTDFLSRAMAFNSHPVAPAETTARESSPATDTNDKPDDSSVSSTVSTASASAKDEQSPSTSPTTSASSTSKPSSPASATTLSASEKASAVERALASASASLVPPSPFTKAPMSAPLIGPTSFPSFKIPPSPALSNLDSPLSAAASMFSPYSGRSSRSVFDWDAALKARCADQKKPKSARTVRHIREVVTRTVTYTPRMEPAPRGKRRKVE